MAESAPGFSLGCHKKECMWLTHMGTVISSDEDNSSWGALLPRPYCPALSQQSVRTQGLHFLALEPGAFSPHAWWLSGLVSLLGVSPDLVMLFPA